MALNYLSPTRARITGVSCQAYLLTFHCASTMTVHLYIRNQNLILNIGMMQLENQVVGYLLLPLPTTSYPWLCPQASPQPLLQVKDLRIVCMEVTILLKKRATGMTTSLLPRSNMIGEN